MGEPVTMTLFAMTVASTVMTAVGQRNAGIAQKQQYDYQSQVAEIQAAQARNVAQAQANMLEYQGRQKQTQAGQQRAASQRSAAEEFRKKELVQSSAIAAAAASGGGSFDPSVADIIGDLESEGYYRQSAALFEGEDAARDLETSANLDYYQAGETIRAGKVQSGLYESAGASYRTAGKNAKSAGNMAAFSTLLKGASDAMSMSQKYGFADSGNVDYIDWNSGGRSYY